ncbi:elongation factor 1-delta isoform X3 [Hemicordylus capensis]|uniref:elongation factor 1-delta isoform X3 n=2 Tax=Hemicordylus capensis TaxID=884348 RepID=UPI00230377E7|nr:elongation factor 1-delta isoform X3 [Hemicordylus capensis]
MESHNYVMLCRTFSLCRCILKESIIHKMRTRKLLYPAEKVWVDKHKYDEAERLHYEREATLAASAAGACQEMVAVNGFYHDEPIEEELKEDLQKAGNGKKQKKRKCTPRARPLDPKVDFVLAGLLADSVWFDKPLFDRAEAAYRKKLAEVLSQTAPEMPLGAKQSALVPWSEVEFQGGVKPERNVAILHCAHGSLIACHHVIQDVWVNKFNFDDAEKVFVERSQLAVLPHFLDLPSVLLHTNKTSPGQTTPDEGYVTALPTPSTPATPALSTDVAHTDASFASPSLLGASNQTVNGKPQMSGLRALISEVWLEKPIYDEAERCFYTNMFDGHPPGKVRLQERGRPESSKKGRKDKKNRSAGKLMAGRRGNHSAASATRSIPQDASSPPTWYFMHKDSESSWLSKPTYDSAEAQYYASEALKLANKQESARTFEATVAKPSQPPAWASSAPESKKMAGSFLMHEKIWFDKFKYDDAEKRYYEQMNGPVPGSSHQKLKTVLQNPHEAPPARRKKQSGRATSVSSTSSTGPGGDQIELVTRIASLEVENQNLHTVVADLQLAISRLETRLSLLEKVSTSHHPSPAPPTQHVTPMKKMEPLAASSRKVELPAASPAKKETPAAEEEEEDDDIDLFGSDDEEEDQEAARIREERLQQYAAKKSKKPGLIAKSSILLDVKPWDDETDMAKMEECVRSVQMDGLVWGASKLVPVGYGIKKLQIQCVVEDDKVGTDILEEEITKFEDYVQSVDIAAFNKI